MTIEVKCSEAASYCFRLFLLQLSYILEKVGFVTLSLRAMFGRPICKSHNQGNSSFGTVDCISEESGRCSDIL